MDLYTQVDNFLKPRAARIEEWQDLARMLISFLIDTGRPGPYRCTQPERTGIGTYMYVVQFQNGTDQNWLVYDDEAGVCEICTKKPVAGEWS